MSRRLLSRRRFLEQTVTLSGALLAQAHGGRAWAAPPAIRIGYIAPTDGRPPAAAAPASVDVAAYSALLGAREAAEEANYTARLIGGRVELLEARARTPDQAVRQAERLTEQGAAALAGGFDPATATALSQFALRRTIIFLNVGVTDDRLRNEACARSTFHVEASDAMYLDAAADWLIRGLAFLVDENAPQGVQIVRRKPARAWFLITEDTGLQHARRGRLQAALAQRHWGGRIVADLVLKDQDSLTPALRAIAETRPDIVFLLQSPAGQLRFYREYEQAHLAFEVTGFPDPATQTRPFFGALLRAAPRTAHGGVRLVSWEPTFAAVGGPQLSQRFYKRWKQPMDGPAWTSWVAVKVVWDSVTQAGTSEASGLLRYLQAGPATFDGYQGIGLTFRPWDHQLRHPLMVSRLTDPGGDASRWAEFVGQFPNVLAPGRDPNEVLDQLGDSAQTSRCRWR